MGLDEEMIVEDPDWREQGKKPGSLMPGPYMPTREDVEKSELKMVRTDCLQAAVEICKLGGPASPKHVIIMASQFEDYVNGQDPSD